MKDEKLNIQPFRLFEYLGTYSVLLSDFWYDFKVCKKLDNNTKYGSGHEYELLFRDYLQTQGFNVTESDFDSELGMFDFVTKDYVVAKKVAIALSMLYKDEDKMIELIQKCNEKYNLDWDC